MSCALLTPPFLSDIYGNDDSILFPDPGSKCLSLTGENLGSLAGNNAMLPVKNAPVLSQKPLEWDRFRGGLSLYGKVSSGRRTVPVPEFSGVCTTRVGVLCQVGESSC